MVLKPKMSLPTLCSALGGDIVRSCKFKYALVLTVVLRALHSCGKERPTHMTGNVIL
jgi:hypothetical protein